LRCHARDIARISRGQQKDGIYLLATPLQTVKMEVPRLEVQETAHDKSML